MSEITISQSVDLKDPILRSIAMRVVRQAELALEKVAANHTQPNKYRLAADPMSVERILGAHFATRPPAVKQGAAGRAAVRINAPAAVRAKRFGDLAAVDLTKQTAVEAQVHALPFPAALKLSPSQLGQFTALHGQILSSNGLIPQQTTNKLELRIHKVKCLDETDGFLGSEAGDDEIDLAGTTVDETGDTQKVNPFRVRSDFDDGEQQVYSPPKRFTYFDLTEGTVFPKSYFVTLVLAEIDMGGLPALLNQLAGWVKTQVTASLTTALGAAIGASGGPVTAIIGAAIGFCVGAIFNLIKGIWGDDVFPACTVSCSIPSLNARWSGKTDSLEGLITYWGHGGIYQVTYDWRLFA